MHFVAVKKSRKFSGVVIYFMSAARGGGGGGRTLNKVIYGEASPHGPTPYLYIPFLTEKIPLSYTFYRQTVPLSHT